MISARNSPNWRLCGSVAVKAGLMIGREQISRWGELDTRR
jgi:hypothetical protein